MRRTVCLLATLSSLSACGGRDDQPSPTDTGPQPPVTVPAPVREMSVTDAADAIIRGQSEQEWFGGRAHLGELTGDGHTDLVVYAGGRESSGTYLFPGPFEGVIPSSDAAMRLIGGQFGLGVGDLDGDGRDDLMVLRSHLEPHEVRIYLHPVGHQTQPDAMFRPSDGADTKLCDANQDGVHDIVVHTHANRFLFSMGPIKSRDMGDEAVDLVLEGSELGWDPRLSRRIVCGHDLTGSGSPDLVVVDESLPRSVWLIEDPPWSGWYQATDIGDEISAVTNGSGNALEVPGDVTGDGHRDLFVAHGMGRLLEGPIHAGSEAYATFEKWTSGSSVAPVGDLDGDGVDDLVIGVGGYRLGGGVFLLFGPVAPGGYDPEDADLYLQPESEPSQLGGGMAVDAGSDLWGTVAPTAHDARGAVYLFSGLPTL